ncbi:UDP-N-acetylglucosamine 2-epimerase [Desulfovirgula thermocuniculi]|uniref:UDP-N-acetylglucosamine 2-epimerase n=1 Tax=Desulfovirgula thermocuniculi TaxID=348842 RepID=UPI000419B50B|nr:UDP-N-acetylglucosamine 2-epimerase [Desulfovirgula thermocuniculi]
MSAKSYWTGEVLSNMRKIMAFSTTRAEFGLLKPILRKIYTSPLSDLILVAAGDHVNPHKGETIQEIYREGFQPIILKECFPEADRPVAITRYTADICVNLARIIESTAPDILLLLGDRHELLAAATVAIIARVPIAHIAGGESTEGAIDEQVRHALTKMSHLHFASTFEYARRIRLMGEEAWRIHVVGAPGVENIHRGELMSPEEIMAKFGIDVSQPTLLVTFHPETLTPDLNPAEEVNILISALKEFGEFQQVITYPGTEVGYQGIIAAWENYARERPNVKLFKSLGSRGYLGVMKHAAAVVGNSSSGVIEAPSFKVPTVNVGDRQKGRIKAESVIDVPCCKEKITAAIRKALYDKVFRNQLEKVKNPYDPFGDGNVSGRIVSVLESVPLGRKLLEKKLDFPGPEEVSLYGLQ